MKISYMTFMTPEWTLDEVVAGARRHGYDGVELRVLCGHKHGIEREASPPARREARQRFADAGIEIACLATSWTFAARDPQQRRENVESLKVYLQLAADVGAPGIRVFGGARPEGMSMEEAIAIVADDLHQACELACQANVGIWLETHDHFSRAADAAAAVTRAGCPCIAVNWDTMHPFRAGETIAESWSALQEGALVRHVHLHDGADMDTGLKLLPIGEGTIPFHAPLRLLRDAGYDGYLSAEYTTNSGQPTRHSPASSPACAGCCQSCSSGCLLSKRLWDVRPEDALSFTNRFVVEWGG